MIILTVCRTAPPSPCLSVELEVGGVKEFNNSSTMLNENSIIDKILMLFSPWVEGVIK